MAQVTQLCCAMCVSRGGFDIISAVSDHRPIWFKIDGKPKKPVTFVFKVPEELRAKPPGKTGK